MIPGEAFEIKCYDYLTKKYGNIFLHKGGMDSTKSDIEVIKNGSIDFYIEAKDSTAQSGQFVLIPDEKTKTFKFSSRNKSKSNKSTDSIINYMNKDFDRFNKAGKAGQSLNINTNVFSTWIIKHYKEKKVKYVISSYENNYIILPIEKFAEYFDISATYRIKKSGSGKPAKKDISKIEKTISNTYKSPKFSYRDKKMLVTISGEVSEENFKIDTYTYYLSKQSDNLYEVRRLSNTYNMNVIFSIQTKRSQDENDLEEFKSDLK